MLALVPVAQLNISNRMSCIRLKKKEGLEGVCGANDIWVQSKEDGLTYEE